MRKLLALLVALFMIAGLAACNGEDPTTEPGETTPDSTVSEPDTTQPDTTEPDVWQPDVGEVGEEDKIDSYAEAFRGADEQGPVWFYLYDDGSGFQELHYTPDWGDNWQYSSVPQADNVYFSLFDWEGLKVWAGLWGETNVKIAIGWRAYQDGTVEIGEWNFPAYDGNAELDGFVGGVKVSILKGNEEIFSATTSSDGEGDVFPGQEVEVTEGDMIFFVFDGSETEGGHENANPSVEDINISYK